MTANKVLTKQDIISLYNQKSNFVSDTEIRNKALDFIEKNDFPTAKQEAWRNSEIETILKHKYILPSDKFSDEVLTDKFSVHNLDAYTLTFINGKFSSVNSDIEHLSDNFYIDSIKNAKEKFPEIIKKYYNSTQITFDSIFSAFNTAFAQDGVFIYTQKNAEPDKPVHLLFYSDGNDSKEFIQYRNLIILGENSNIKIIKSYHSLSFDIIFTNINTEIFLEQNSSLELNIFQGEGERPLHINNTRVIQNRDTNLTVNFATMCGDFVRNSFIVDLNGANSNSQINGFYLPEKEQHFDTHIKINHNSPNCSSNQLFKGIIDNKASASFFGKVYVARDSQKTDANQTNKNILLTDYAKVFSKPQLEIYADDVSCSHGSTTGQIDKEALFYLRSRGISERNAKTLMLYAFISDVIDQIKITPYKELLYFLLNKRLKGEKIEGLCSLKICPS